MTETRELQDQPEPRAPSPKRPASSPRPSADEPIPDTARLDYVAPDGSTDTAQPEGDEGGNRG